MLYEKKRTRRRVSSQRNTRKSVVLFAVQKPPLFCTKKSKPGVPSTDLHPKWLSFHLLSLAEIFSLHYEAHKTHALLYYYIIMAGEEETETFAFQAEINQLLSLIINVRFKSALVLYAMYLFQRARSVFFLFPRKSFHRDERFFSSLLLRDDTDPFLSLFNARIHRRSTRTKRSFCENWSGTFICVCVLLSKTANEREKRKFRWRDGSSFVSRSAADWIVSLLMMIAKKTNA